jgi:hypothetical protein
MFRDRPTRVWYYSLAVRAVAYIGSAEMDFGGHGMKIAIIGSCVTRDIWTMGRELPGDVFYIGRSSIISIMSSAGQCWPIFSDTEDLSKFSNYMWIADVEKTALKAIAAFKPDVLIMDFVDERFNILGFDGHYVTNSKELAESKFLNEMPLGKVLRRGNPEVEQLWIESAEQFVIWLEKTLPEARIVIHHAQWATKYVETASIYDARLEKRFHSILDGPSGERWNIRKYSKMCVGYSDKISQLIKKSISISARPEFIVGSDLHMWGPAPFHYVKEYYLDTSEKLRSVLR